MSTVHAVCRYGTLFSQELYVGCVYNCSETLFHSFEVEKEEFDKTPQHGCFFFFLSSRFLVQRKRGKNEIREKQGENREKGKTRENQRKKTTRKQRENKEKNEKQREKNNEHFYFFSALGFSLC